MNIIIDNHHHALNYLDDFMEGIKKRVKKEIEKKYRLWEQSRKMKIDEGILIDWIRDALQGWIDGKI